MNRRNLGPGDRWTLGVLVAIPVVVFVVPALFGHAIVNADNQIQNFPLRALAGEDLRHGRLPLWNPYIWSGSPLLGGLNAGALYPFTWLFAVLPALAAWTANLVVVYVTTAVGTYAFLRQQSLRPFSAGFAAASFAFAGSMSAQMVHIGIVQGASWIPWMLLVEQRLAHQLLGPEPVAADRSPSVGRRVTLLGLLGGLVLLTGEPRGMADAAVVVGLAGLWHLLRGRPAWQARVRFVASFVVAAVLATVLGAVQLLPGWSFIADSQRAQRTVAFFGSGSLPVRWSLLMLVPDLIGGTGVFHQPTFLANYNLPEVTGYVGILPLMAVAGLLARSFGTRRHPRARQWTAWFGLVVVGLVLSYGTYTPLGPFLARLPFYGDLRLQSRNVVIAGLGLCVLLAYWLDIVLDPAAHHVRRRLTGVVTVVPAVAVVGLCVATLFWPTAVEEWLGVSDSMAHLGAALAPWLAASLAVAVAAVLVGLGYGRLTRKWRVGVLGTLITVDLVLFTLSSVPAVNVAFPAPVLPTPSTAVPVVDGTRFAVFDPANEYLNQFAALAENDLNTLVHSPSVEGYGSLTDNGYQTATGTRTHNTLNPCALAEGVFVPLGLGTLLTVADDLMQRTGGPAATLTSVPTRPCPVSPPPSSRRTWWFGRPLAVAGASVPFTSGVPNATGVRVGLLSASGATRWTTATVTSTGPTLTIGFATPVVGSGLVVAGGGAAGATDATTVTTASGARYVMDGFLQSALRDASFRFTGYRQGIPVFRTARTARPVSLVARGATAGAVAPGARSLGTAHRVGLTSWGRETDTVTAHRPVTLVRSEAYSAGWRADVRDTATGRHATVAVVRVGLVQGIRLAPGTYTVTWSYQPTSVTVGLLGSAAGALVVVGAGTSWFWRRRSQRRRPSSPVRVTATPRAPTASSGAATRA